MCSEATAGEAGASENATPSPGYNHPLRARPRGLPPINPAFRPGHPPTSGTQSSALLPPASRPATPSGKDHPAEPPAHRLPYHPASPNPPGPEPSLPAPLSRPAGNRDRTAAGCACSGYKLPHSSMDKACPRTSLQTPDEAGGDRHTRNHGPSQERRRSTRRPSAGKNATCPPPDCASTSPPQRDEKRHHPWNPRAAAPP